MESDSKAATVRSLDRINLRLAGDTFAGVDACCAAGPGDVSLNTWITDTDEERLAGERAPTATVGERRVHG
jgi:hypothetical protein